MRRIPATVSFLNPQPALSLVGGNPSSCPISDIQRNADRSRRLIRVSESFWTRASLLLPGEPAGIHARSHLVPSAAARPPPVRCERNMPTSSIPPNMVRLPINSTTSGHHRKPVLFRGLLLFGALCVGRLQWPACYRRSMRFGGVDIPIGGEKLSFFKCTELRVLKGGFVELFGSALARRQFMPIKDPFLELRVVWWYGTESAAAAPSAGCLWSASLPRAIRPASLIPQTSYACLITLPHLGDPR